MEWKKLELNEVENSKNWNEIRLSEKELRRENNNNKIIQLWESKKSFYIKGDWFLNVHGDIFNYPFAYLVSGTIVVHEKNLYWRVQTNFPRLNTIVYDLFGNHVLFSSIYPIETTTVKEFSVLELQMLKQTIRKENIKNGMEKNTRYQEKNTRKMR